jgi:hypothetical protein
VPIVSEVYGLPIHLTGVKLPNILDAICPYTRKVCDGGGNRDMAQVSLAADAGIRARFSAAVIKAASVSCGICSVRLNNDDWIICPRRLLNFSSEDGWSDEQSSIVKLIFDNFAFKKKSIVGIWNEISIREKQGDAEFNYRLDYLIREKIGQNYGPPLIVEIMTCSTSGGNKSKGSDISTSFRKAILTGGDQRIESPGVNVRQVWARMASQLIVKAELAMHWGGHTVWVIQDKLADYINNQTGLDLDHFRSNKFNEVNIISVPSNGDAPILYSGPISGSKGNEKGFIDILRTPILPSAEKLEFERDKGFLGNFVYD